MDIDHLPSSQLMSCVNKYLEPTQRDQIRRPVHFMQKKNKKNKQYIITFFLSWESSCLMNNVSKLEPKI